VDRINTAGIEWFDTGVAFDTKAQALAYITERTP
jgi:hypothetical protein